MQTFIISLAERADRRKRVSSQLNAQDYTHFRFWDAVKGAEKGIEVAGLSKGELGLWLSTIEVIQEHIESASTEALHIAEDDCTFSNEFFRTYRELEKAITNSDIDILFTDGWARGRLLEEILSQCATSGIRILPGSFYAGRTTSYIINPNSIVRVSRILQDGLAMMCSGRIGGEPIDRYYRISNASGNLRLAVCAPFITCVSQDMQIAESDIAETEAAEDKRWEQLHTLTSQIPYTEYDNERGVVLLARILRDLDKKHLAELVNGLVPWLTSLGYIQKARQKPRKDQRQASNS